VRAAVEAIERPHAAARDRRRRQPQDDRPDAARQFVEKTGIPFVTTQMGKGVVDERHPLFLGCAALSDGDFVHRAIEAPT
jgi:acetolactate synthase I/II/III large subunit